MVVVALWIIVQIIIIKGIILEVEEEDCYHHHRQHYHGNNEIMMMNSTEQLAMPVLTTFISGMQLIIRMNPTTGPHLNALSKWSSENIHEVIMQSINIEILIIIIVAFWIIAFYY